MSTLLDSLAAAFAGDAAGRARLAAIVAEGLPHARSEAWRYMPLRALERRSFAAAPATAPAFDPALLAGIAAPRVVFVNGVYDDAHSDLSGLAEGITVDTRVPGSVASGDDEGEGVFVRMNAQLASHGLQLHVAAGSRRGEPLHLVCIGTGGDAGEQAWHLRHQVTLEAGAELDLVEHQLANGAHRHLDNTVVAIAVGEGASLRHLRVQAGSEGATTLQHTRARLDARAGYQRVDLELGGGLVRHALDVELAGEQARLGANGVLLATARRHVETRLGVVHRARDTGCELLWRGIADGRGRVVFHGGITIDAGADGTDARLSNKNLLLSANAEIDTQPVLVIHADEVQAAHGATVGQLDANALFYLRSRGIPEAESRRLLTAAFVREPLSAIEDAGLREALDTHLDAALEGLSS